MPATRDKRRRSSKSAKRSASAWKSSVAARARRDKEAPHIQSPTAVAAEALRTGVAPQPAQKRRDEIPHEGEKIRVGDPDDSVLLNEYSGEDTPGGSTPTPDQNVVDEIGTAYGLQEEDSGALRSADEVLTRRDKHRSELQPPRRPQEP